MSHPDPGEALPDGQDSLSPEELDELATFMFELEAINRYFLPDDEEKESMPAAQQEVYDTVEQNLREITMNVIKQKIIDRREQA